jgi:hypothetical protein
MKTAGDILSALFDERFVQKARGYSKLFDSWEDITAKNGIAAAAAHSQIKDLDRGILLVEMDHPGWKQILQTKQSSLLNDFRCRFPELDISGISLMLGRSALQNGQETETETGGNPPISEYIKGAEEKSTIVEEPNAQAAAEKASSDSYDDIKDEDLKKTLKRLERTISGIEKA